MLFELQNFFEKILCRFNANKEKETFRNVSFLNCKPLKIVVGDELNE